MKQQTNNKAIMLFENEKLIHILLYASYANGCAVQKEIPLSFEEWKKIIS